MKQHLLIIIISLAIVCAACARHSTESSEKSLTDSLITDKQTQFYFDTIIETGSTRVVYEKGKIVYFISKSKLKSPGYMVSFTGMFKPENYKQDNLQRLDTLNEAAYMDIYAIKGDNTRCIAYIDNLTPPIIVLSVKDNDISTPDDLEKVINNFFNDYGFISKESILDYYYSLHFDKEKNQMAKKAFQLADNYTRHNLDKMFGNLSCISYDLPSDKGIYEKADSTLLELRQQIARQEYIDSVAKLAHYSKPAKYASVVANLLKADPETVVFVSDYLTDKKR